MLWLLNLSDGDADLLDIALRAGLPFGVIRDAADALVSAGLLANDLRGIELRRSSAGFRVSSTEIIGTRSATLTEQWRLSERQPVLAFSLTIGFVVACLALAQLALQIIWKTFSRSLRVEIPRKTLGNQRARLSWTTDSL